MALQISHWLDVIYFAKLQFKSLMTCYICPSLTAELGERAGVCLERMYCDAREAAMVFTIMHLAFFFLALLLICYSNISWQEKNIQYHTWNRIIWTLLRCANLKSWYVSSRLGFSHHQITDFSIIYKCGERGEECGRPSEMLPSEMTWHLQKLWLV